MKSKIKFICISAIFAAMYVVLDIAAVELNSVFGGMMKFSFSALPVILGALLLGPIWGASVGLIGAFIGQLFSEYGLTLTTPLWILPAFALGMTVGMLYLVFGRSNKRCILIIITVVGALLRTALNTLAMYIDAMIFKYPVVIFGVGLVNRTVSSILIVIAISLVLPPALSALRKVIKV